MRFVAIHSLVFRDNLAVVNYSSLYNLLSGIGDELFPISELDDMRLVQKMNNKMLFIKGKIVEHLQNPQ